MNKILFKFLDGLDDGTGKEGGGFDFSSIGTMLGNLISTNPQMLVTMAQSLIQQNGVNYESITNVIGEKFDLDTILSMASALGFDGSNLRLPRGEGEDLVSLNCINLNGFHINEVKTLTF